MMVLVKKREIPAHKAIPIEDCETQSWDKRCASCNAVGKSTDGVTCVTVLHDFTAKIPGWIYWDFKAGSTKHFCAPCYRAIF